MDYPALAQLLYPDVTMTPGQLEERFPPRALNEGAIVSRSAPSPTGFVHLGNLVQGLTSERLCHQSGGVLYLRIEDTDLKRQVSGAVSTLISALSYYGIVFDEGAEAAGERGIYGPYRQRQRKDIYHVYAKQMVCEGLAYPCFCTAEDLRLIRETQKREKLNFGYYGRFAKWRDRPMGEIEDALKARTPWVLRFRSTGDVRNKIKFTDLVKGPLLLSENDIDHVLLKSDGIPTYHFAHAVDDHLMRTTHVVRDDSWLPSLPFHLQLFRALDFKAPKYLHIGPLMKMDGMSKRKLSKRKDPELALSFYMAEGFPAQSVYEYLLTVLNSNYEDWRAANPDAPADSFKFSASKLNAAGALFDAQKLRDVSKNVISRMDAAQVYDLLSAWALEYDKPFGQALAADRGYAERILAIGRGGKKPRKDLAVWREARGYMGFFYDPFFAVEEAYPDAFSAATIARALRGFLETYDPQDDQAVWFDKIKAVAEGLGFAGDMKAYRADPERYPGSVADVSMFLRVAVTGKTASPDMYAAMAILGPERVRGRVDIMIKKLER